MEGLNNIIPCGHRIRVCQQLRFGVSELRIIHGLTVILSFFTQRLIEETVDVFIYVDRNEIRVTIALNEKRGAYRVVVRILLRVCCFVLL